MGQLLLLFVHCLFYFWIITIFEYLLLQGLLQSPPLLLLQENGCDQEQQGKKVPKWLFVSSHSHVQKTTGFHTDHWSWLLIFLLHINNCCSYMERSLHSFWKWFAGKQQQEIWLGNLIVKQWDILQSKLCQISGSRGDFSHQKEIFI